MSWNELDESVLELIGNDGALVLVEHIEDFVCPDPAEHSKHIHQFQIKIIDTLTHFHQIKTYQTLANSKQEEFLQLSFNSQDS